jgi:hypothetical protein
MGAMMRFTSFTGILPPAAYPGPLTRGAGRYAAVVKAPGGANRLPPFSLFCANFVLRFRNLAESCAPRLYYLLSR